MSPKGQVAVAKYYPGKPMPRMKGFKNVLSHVKPEGLGGPLSPYNVRDENGTILENKWQFSKLYPRVTSQRIPKSRWQPEIIWQHPEEYHLDSEGNPTAQYWAWREKGMKAEYPIRYPNGFHGRKNCIYSLVWCEKTGLWWEFDYINSRKAVYCAEYSRLAPSIPEFQHLKEMVDLGENVMLIEVDGPDPSLNHYPYSKISLEEPGLVINEDIIRYLLHDETKPFGHGYVLAALLLDGTEWLQ